MSTRAVTQETSAVSNEDLVTPGSLEEALDTGFLPEDPHYRLTGEFKDKQKDQPVKEEASATSADTSTASAAVQSQEKDKGPAQTKNAKSGDNRWQKLSKENQELRERLARLEGRSEASSDSRDGKQASQPAPEAKTTEPKETDKNPDGTWKYKTLGEYQAALREYDRKSLLAEFEQRSAQTAQEQQRLNAEKVIGETLARKYDAARSKYQDFDAVALNPELLIPKGSTVDGFLLNSDHVAEVLYHLGQHPDILNGFYGDFDASTGKFTNKVNPFQQVRTLMQIENEVSGKPKPAPAKTVTQAPRPPHQLDGKSSVAKDAVAQAVEDGDVETYIREQNARELARRRK